MGEDGEVFCESGSSCSSYTHGEVQFFKLFPVWRGSHHVPHTAHTGKDLRSALRKFLFFLLGLAKADLAVCPGEGARYQELPL